MIYNNVNANCRIFCFRTPIIYFFISILNACSTLSTDSPNDNKWGANATLFPSTDRLANAALNAASNPSTWAPLIGAGILTIKDNDNKITEHAFDDNPVFGTADNANDASDLLRDSLVASVLITSLATPSGKIEEDWMGNKTKGLLVQFGALKSTSIVTAKIKDLSKRERPNEINRKSFPSGHSSRAFAAATLTSRNLDSLALSDSQKTGIRIGLYSFATGTAWARIEAGMHHPTDVLVGAALGNFMANFIHDAFLGLNADTVELKVDAYHDYKSISFVWHF